MIIYLIGVILAYIVLQDESWKIKIGCLLSWIIILPMTIMVIYEIIKLCYR